MDLGIQGKIALVTGSSKGIGYAAAEGFAREGATVIVNGRSRQSVDQAIDKIRKNVPRADLKGSVADLGSAEGCESLIKDAPRVDILVNNVGIFEPTPFDEISDADWQRFFDINVMSGVRLTRHYLKGMRESNWGRIVFISSESGVQIPTEMIHYGMTKTAQIAIARGVAETLTGTNITCNSVLPGPTSSEGVEEFIGRMAADAGKDRAEFEKDFVKEARPSSIIGRLATVDEVANMIVYACSECASATNGAALRVDGGVVRAIP